MSAATARANTSSHHGGGGGSAQCIRWAPIVQDLGARDMADVDGGAALDMGSLDMAGHAGERCVEYASLFSCAMAPVARSSSAAVPLVGVAFVLALVRRRHRD